MQLQHADYTSDGFRKNDSLRRRRGFTLVELLVVIAIIALLSALLVPSVSGARRKSQRAHCAHTMKQVGIAIQMYVDENKDYLPGPIDVGVPVNYTRTSSQVLTYHIARYLDLPSPAKIPSGQSQMAWQLVCAGFRIDGKITNSASLQARCYSLNWSSNTTADAWFPFKPFGYISPSTNAHTMTEIVYMSPPSERWMMQDVDQEIVEAKNWQWYPNLPTKPTHRPMWNRLYFDQHVATVNNPDHATTSASYAP